MLHHFLLTDPFRLGFVAFFISQGLDFVVLRKTFYHLWLDLSRGRFLHAILAALRPHSANSAHRSCRRACHWVNAIADCILIRLAEHHQPLVMLVAVLLLELFGFLP